MYASSLSATKALATAAHLQDTGKYLHIDDRFFMLTAFKIDVLILAKDPTDVLLTGAPRALSAKPS